MAIAGFFAGLFADWATYLGTSVDASFRHKREMNPFMPIFTKIAISFIPTQLPLGILEGAMTAGIVVLLSKRRPDLLIKMGVLKSGQAVLWKTLTTAGIFLVIFFMFCHVSIAGC